jgi:hypothetical protein
MQTMLVLLRTPPVAAQLLRFLQEELQRQGKQRLPVLGWGSARIETEAAMRELELGLLWPRPREFQPELVLRVENLARS